MGVWLWFILYYGRPIGQAIIFCSCGFFLSFFFCLKRRLTKLGTTFGSLLSWYTIHTFSGALALNGILPGAKFTTRPSLVFSYWQRYCTVLEQWASTKLCGVEKGREITELLLLVCATYIPQGSHHVWHRPSGPTPHSSFIFDRFRVLA